VSATTRRRSSTGFAGATIPGEVSEGGGAPLRWGDGLRDALDPRKVLAK